MVNSSDVQSPKRIKLDPGVGSDNQEEDPPNDQNAELVDGEGEDENGENCSICLSNLEDRTVIPSCSHEFCFECLVVWTGQSRRCPLCNQPIGEYLIHNIRSQYDYRKHYLTPLRTTPPPQVAARRNVFTRQRQERRQRTRRTQEQLSEVDKFDRSLAKRRWIYRHDLYAKHVASNPHTKFRPYPKPSQFAASADLISRTTAFIRRELQVWEGMDVEFLTTLIISLMKSIDIRSESAVKLISEFLDLDAPYSPGSRQTNAEHFAHEVYSYVRSPYKDLFIYDNIVQYDTPAELPLPEEIPRRRRWDEVSRSRSRSPEFVQGSSRSAVDGTNGQLRSRTPPSPLRRRAPATSSEDVSRDDVDQDGRTSPSTPPEASGTSSRASKGKRKCMASESAPEALRIATTTTSSYSQGASTSTRRTALEGFESSSSGPSSLELQPTAPSPSLMSPSRATEPPLTPASSITPLSIKGAASGASVGDKPLSIKGASSASRGNALGLSIKGASSRLSSSNDMPSSGSAKSDTSTREQLKRKLASARATSPPVDVESRETELRRRLASQRMSQSIPDPGDRERELRERLTSQRQSSGTPIPDNAAEERLKKQLLDRLR